VETLLDGGLADRDNARKFLEIIHRHSERLGRLLHDLLELSNIELEQTPLHLRPVACAEAARQGVALLAPQADKKNIQLVTAIPDHLPTALADRDRLVQVLVNLLDNAVKYTPDGGTVTVTARAGSAGDSAGIDSTQAPHAPDFQPSIPGPWVEIAVADTGIGIPSKDLPRLTERFYRVDKARSRELGGTGLGLAIVKHLIAAQNGALSIESTPGKGTLVRIALPVAPMSPLPSS
jgi:two-component system phosphate regulon sensor histidine kinase PhoR